MDVVQMAFDYLIKTNGTTPHPETSTSDEANFTLIVEISRTDVNYEYGNYNRHSANVYYQNIHARVFKIDRITYAQSEVPDAYYNKYVCSSSYRAYMGRPQIFHLEGCGSGGRRMWVRGRGCAPAHSNIATTICTFIHFL
jgi:hypothetical protein